MTRTLSSLAAVALALSTAPVSAEPAPPAPAPAAPPSNSAPVASPPPASAPSPPADLSAQLREASERYQRALKSYDEGNFDAALVEFRRAYQIAPTFRILYNLGVVSLELRDYASALTYFERYLVEGDAQVSAEQRSEVEQKIRDLQGHVARVTVVVDVPGAEIAVDDRVVGVAPLAAPLRLNAGARRLSARANGRLPDSRLIDLAGGDKVQVELNLATFGASPSGAASVSAAAAPPPRYEPSRPIPWLPWAGTAVLAGAAVFSGLQALSAQRDYDDELDRPGASRASLEDKSDSALRYSIAADAFGIGALALGGYSLYLTLRPNSTDHGDRSDREPRALGFAPRSTRSSRPRLGVGVSPTGAVVHGTF